MKDGSRENLGSGAVVLSAFSKSRKSIVEI